MTNWLKKVKEKYEDIRPLQHYNYFSAKGKTFWSIQTEQTHGISGLVKVSKTEIEDPKLAFQNRNSPHIRYAGAENIFNGTKEAVRDFVMKTYPGTRKIEFV